MPRTTLSKIRQIIDTDKRKSWPDLPDGQDRHGQRPLPSSMAGDPTATGYTPRQDHAISLVDTPKDSFPDKALAFSYRPRKKEPQKKRAHITATTKKELMALEGQATIRELSERYGIPPSTLYRWAKKTGYRAKKGTPPSPIPAKTAQMIREDLDRMTTAELAKRYDIPYHVLYHWLKKEELSARKTSSFPIEIQKELRERCRTAPLKDLAQEYGLSQQAMRRRLQDIGCFSDGKGGFLIVDDEIAGAIVSCYQQKGLEEAARIASTTKAAIKSFLKRYCDP